MSTTRKGPVAGRGRRRRPRTTAGPPRRRGSSSGATPRSRRRRRRTRRGWRRRGPPTWRPRARRAAPWRSSASRYSRSAASVRSMARARGGRCASTPAPRRVIVAAPLDVAGRRRATRRRMELVPMSIAARIDRHGRRASRGEPAHRQLRSRPSGRRGRRHRRGTRRSGRGGTSRPGGAADAAARTRSVRRRGMASVALGGVAGVGVGDASASTSASARRTPPAASRRLTASALGRAHQPVAGRHRACRRRAAARCGSRPGRAVGVAHDDLEGALRCAPEQRARRRASVAPSSSRSGRRRRSSRKQDQRATTPTGTSRLSQRCAGGVEQVDRLRPRAASHPCARRRRRPGAAVAPVGGADASCVGRAAPRSPSPGAAARRPLGRRRWLPWSRAPWSRGCRRTAEQLRADVGQRAPAELGDLAGDGEVGRDGDLGDAVALRRRAGR